MTAHPGSKFSWKLGPHWSRISPLIALAVIGFSCLILQLLDIGPHALARIGAVLVSTALVWAMAARSGGRPLLFAAVALVVCTVIASVGDDALRTGAAVMTAALSAVHAIIATIPARRMRGTVVECLLAAIIAIGGSVAALGYDPVITIARYQYIVLAIAVVITFTLVYQLGAGFHGLGRRGVLIVAVGGVVLIITLLYANLLRAYVSSLSTSLENAQHWGLTHLHGYPRPVEALLGVPALMWGTHMRARRRQGWWVCAFGVAFTAPVATTLANPDLSVVDTLLTTVYSLVVGILIGLVLIRADLLFTGGPQARGRRAAGRRAARLEEQAHALRPEPPRSRPLL